MTPVLLDAGPLIALFDEDDLFHRRYRALLADARQQVNLYTTWPCVVEASHMLGDVERLEMLKWVSLGGVQVFPFDAPALADMAVWMARYTEQPRTRMDFADASLYWLAQESGVMSIMTLDVRDFSRYRLPDGRAFDIL